jgi:hypothetical protein
MTRTEPATRPFEPPAEPAVEWWVWAYGGIRVLHAERMLAWLTNSGGGEELLFAPRRHGGSFAVGLLYPVLVTRRDGRTHMHGWPGKAHGRVDATHAALLRAEHHAAQARLALLRVKRRRWVASGWTRRSNRQRPSREDSPTGPIAPHCSPTW